jgi:hypothetical protein
MIVTADIEAAACMRFKIPEWKWEQAKKRFPSLLQKVNQKRLRRMEYVLATGNLPPSGWTPPDPKNRSTQNVPPYAFLGSSTARTDYGTGDQKEQR